ncbi:MAG: hypothetical protein ACI8RA_001337 [Chlamydiales bacterium]|jgi:hypothetical protein
MRLREISFTSTRQLVEFANYRHLDPSQVQSIIKGAHANDKLGVTLVFWDNESMIPPLEETDPVFEEDGDNSIVFKPSGVSLNFSTIDKTKANLAYSKMKVALEEAKGTPEKMGDYLERKESERIHRDRIKSAKSEVEFLEDHSESDIGISTFSSRRDSIIEEVSEEETLKRKKLWEDVHSLWKKRHEGVQLSVPFEKLTFQGSTIFVPMYCFGTVSEGAVFYNLSRVVEEIFGDNIILEHQ